MKILIGLHRNVNALDKKTSKIAAEYNLTFSQFMVLEALYSKGDMSVGEVRERILSSVGTIPLIVNNLVKMNYVERMCNEKDRRVCILHLTQEGYDVISKIVPRNEAMIAESMEVLDQEEKEKLLYLLMKRKVKTKVKGFRTTDGAGVKLVRVLGNLTTKEFDPILMLDSFDSINPDDYTAGFPMHPHRGIETISYVSRGKMVHRDSLGNEAGISDGEVQWMNSGSGIMHEEMVPAAERLLGVQLWLNLPAKDKMSKPSYNSIKNEDIKEIEIEGGKIRLLAGKYGEHEGYKGDYLSMDYYDIHLNADAEVTLTMEEDDSVMVFTLLGDVYIDGEHIEEKTAVKLTEGDSLTIKNGNEKAQVLYMNSRALNEPVAWAGPIVMNTQEELQKAFLELRSNTFIKETAEY